MKFIESIRFPRRLILSIYRPFTDIYEWAGELRGYDIRKGICEFTPYPQIEYFAGEVYKGLQDEDYLRDLSLETFIERLAYYYDTTNRLHPFPEGNGRAQRLLIEHLAANAGYLTDWAKVPELMSRFLPGKLLK